MSEFTSKTLTCSGCGRPFSFSAGEQEFYQQQGFKHDPKRCKECRKEKKLRYEGGQ
jgi:hypothetical protein